MAYFTIPHRPTFGAPVFCSAYSASRNARASAASRPPSSHTMLFSPKRTCFRFAARTLRVQGSQSNPSGAARQLSPSHRNAPSGRSGVAHGFFSEKSILCSFLQNAHASGSLRSPYGCLRARSLPCVRGGGRRMPDGRVPPLAVNFLGSLPFPHSHSYSFRCSVRARR